MIAFSANPDAPERFEFDLEPEPEAVGEARRRVVSAARRWLDHRQLSTLELLISEVVTNAVRHGSASETVTVSVTRRDACVCVQITDRGAGLVAEPRGMEPDRAGGWGLYLVEQLTSRWGVTRERGRTRVWFELDAAAADSPPGLRRAI